MSVLEVFVIGMTFGSVVGGMSVQWSNDRVELHKLRSKNLKAKKPTHTKSVKHKQMEYKGAIDV